LDFWISDFDKKEVREKRPLKEVTIGLSCDKCYLSGSCPSFAPDTSPVTAFNDFSMV
jgi:hypothetical protein